MEWIRGQDLLIQDSTITCCDKSSYVLMVCLSPLCRQRQRTVCRKCSTVHKDHSQALIDIETFVRETSERHDTTKKLKTYCIEKSERDYPTNQIDSIIQGSIVQTKLNFHQRFQAIQDSIVTGMNKIMGKVTSFEKTRENVMKIDKRKGDHIGSLPTTSLEMAIDMYWKSDENLVQEEDVPEKVEIEIQRFNETVQSLLNESFKTIENEVQYHLHQVKKILRKERVQQFITAGDGSNSDSEPVRFSIKQKFTPVPKRKVIWKNANSEDFQQKINENHALLEKDLEILKDNNITIVSEDANLHELSHRYFSTLGEKIEAKKGEIDRLEKSKNINTLKFARNQLSNMIRLQVQQSKQFTAQKVRVDSRIHEVVKSLEAKQEEFNESKIMVQKVSKQISIQRQIERSEYEKSIAGSQMGSIMDHESSIEGMNLYDNIEPYKSSQQNQRSKSSYGSLTHSTTLVSRNQRSQSKANEVVHSIEGPPLKNVSFLTSKSSIISNDPSTERGASSERKQPRNLQFNGYKSSTNSAKNSLETFPAARAVPANLQSLRSSTKNSNNISFHDQN